MEKYFTVHNPLPGVYQIHEALGVCTTLLVGADAALLVDTGYGLWDLQGQVREITPLPLTVINTHAHFDHTGGNGCFETVYMPLADMDMHNRSGGSLSARRRTAMSAQTNGIVPTDFDVDKYVALDSNTVGMPMDGVYELGGLTARVIAAPGHTPGSVVIYAQELRLLITGDSWNASQTWLFLSDCIPLDGYVRSMRGLLGLPFDHVLASHSAELHKRERLEAYINALTDETFNSAVPSAIGDRYGVSALECRPEPGTLLIFDPAKRYSSST